MNFTQQFIKAPWFVRIRTLRALQGWSQDEAAEKIGTSKRLYWNWENGEHYPTQRNRTAIANSFGVTENEIFGEIA